MSPLRGPALAVSGCEQLEHLPVERWNIIRLAAGDHVAVTHGLLIDPIGARVFQVCYKRRPGRHAATARRAGFQDGPWAVADRRDRLSGVEEGFHEGHGLWLHAELIRVHG